MPPMNLDYLSWEAFATLITGIAAVVAAYRVGRRQVEISARQADIQERLAGIEETKLKQSLHDARFQIIYATRRWRTATIRDGVPPYFNKKLEGTQLEIELKWADEFLDAVAASAYFFKSEVHDVLWKMWLSGEALTAQRLTKDGQLVDIPQTEKSIKARDEAMAYLKNVGPKLDEIFGDELNLATPIKIKDTNISVT